MASKRLLLPVLCSAGLVWAATAQAGAPAEPLTPALLEARLLAAVNAYREDSGLAPLERNAAIAAVARAHSEAMAAGSVPFGHAGLRQRADAIAASVPVASLFENVARHQRQPAELVDETLRGWLASAAHRRNLRSDCTQSGVGVAQSPGGILYVTQILVAVKPAAAAP